MTNYFMFFLFGAAALLGTVLIFTLGLKIGALIERKNVHKELKEARSDAVKRSRSVLNGQFSEQMAVFFPAFPANPTEVRFIGKPVDFIAFSGSSSGTIDEVLFIEVKTGSAGLNKVERSLKDAIDHKRVRYCEYRIPAP